jgi:hypothetical protein
MSDETPDRIGSVLDPALRRPFSLIVAVVVSVGVVIMGLSKAEAFVDGRVEMKLAAQREKSDEQADKLKRMEEQFLLMRDTLAEIRADVRVLRSRIESGDAAAAEKRRQP